MEPKKKFFARIIEGIVNAWNWLTGKLKVIVPDVVDIVQKIKETDEAGLLDIVKLAIPGKKDDVIIEKYRTVFLQVVLILGQTKEILALPTDEERFKAIIVAIKGSHPDAQKAFWTSLANLVVEKLADGKLTWLEAMVIVKHVYDNREQLKNEGNDGIDNDGDGNIDEEDES